MASSIPAAGTSPTSLSSSTSPKPPRPSPSPSPRPSKKQQCTATATAARSSATAALSLAGLAPELYAHHLLSCLGQRETLALRLVSRGTKAAVDPGVRTIKLRDLGPEHFAEKKKSKSKKKGKNGLPPLPPPWKPDAPTWEAPAESQEALLRLLWALTGLEEASGGRWGKYDALIVRALGGDGSGSRLRRLGHTSASGPELARFAEELAAGALPHLTEIGLPSTFGSSQAKVKAGLAALVDALEARRDKLGLPPVTSITHTRYRDARALARLWACCPPGELTALEASGEAQLAAFLRLLAGENCCPALRELSVDDHELRDHPSMGKPESPGLVRVMQALARGCAPSLERLSLGWGDGRRGAILKELGRGLGTAGALPALASLSVGFEEMSTDGLRALLAGLRARTGGGGGGRGSLRSLSLGGGFDNSDLDFDGLAAALGDPDGGLGRGLEELKLECLGVSCDAVCRALATGPAPCAPTLRALTIQSYEIEGEGLAALLTALGGGGFPVLAELDLMWEEDESALDIPGALGEALLKPRANGGAPWRLTVLILYGPCDEWARWLEGPLAQAFAAGLLPRLTHLHVRHSRWLMCRLGIDEQREEEPAPSPGFLGAWAALGAAVRLEEVAVAVPEAPSLAPHFLAALADPGFCPALRKMRLDCADFRVPEDDVQEAFEARARAREAAAAAAAAGDV